MNFQQLSGHEGWLKPGVAPRPTGLALHAPNPVPQFGERSLCSTPPLQTRQPYRRGYPKENQLRRPALPRARPGPFLRDQIHLDVSLARNAQFQCLYLALRPALVGGLSEAGASSFLQIAFSQHGLLLQCRYLPSRFRYKPLVLQRRQIDLDIRQRAGQRRFGQCHRRRQVRFHIRIRNR